MNAAARHNLILEPEMFTYPASLAGKYLRVIPYRAGGFEEARAVGLFALVTAANTFTPGRGSTFKGYAGTCIKHAIIDLIRAEHRKRPAGTEELTRNHRPLAASGPDPETLAADVREQVERSGLTPNELLVVRLVDLEEMTIVEAAAATGFHQSKVKRLHAEAMTKLWFNPHFRDLYNEAA